MKPTTTISRFAILIFTCALASGQSSLAVGKRYALVVAGPGGQAEFTEKYREQTVRLYDVLSDSLDYQPADITYLFEDPSRDSLRITGEPTAANVRAAFRSLRARMKPDDQLAVFLIGHGTFDGHWGKFNLVGPDLKDIEYAQLLAGLPSQKVVFVNMSSASGPFVNKVSGEKRVVVTATKSGTQYFETNFMDFFLDAIASHRSDANKDGRVSLLEAFTFARTSQDNWFEEKRRIRAEHPLLDDNGDGIGSQRLKDSKDGLLAARVYLGPASRELESMLQRAQAGADSPKDKLLLEKLQLEQKIDDLKAAKVQMDGADYAQQLETLLIQLAQMNRRIKNTDSGISN